MKNRLLVTGIVLGALAVLLVLLLTSGWGHTGGYGMMGPVTIAPMGGMMFVGPGEIIILLLGTITFVILAAWVLRSGGRQK